MASELIKRPVSNQPIPEDAQLVFKGQLFEVFQWKQVQFDGSLRTFEKLKRPDTVVVVPVTSDGYILTTEQEQPGRSAFSGLVGGRQEANETVYETAQREMREEIGYSCEKLSLWFATHPTTKIDWVVYYVVATGCAPTGTTQNDVGEKVKLVEKSFEDFLQLAFESNFVEVEVIPKMLKALISDQDFNELKKRIFG